MEDIIINANIVHIPPPKISIFPNFNLIKKNDLFEMNSEIGPCVLGCQQKTVKYFLNS